MTLLSVSQLSKTERGNAVLKNISFTQNHLQKLAIAGETGSGKSSLLKAIGGLIQPDNGKILFGDKKIIGPDEQLIPGHKGIKYLSQQFELPHFLTVAQVLEYANELTEEDASLLYEVCRIKHLMNRRTDQLSGGEQQRIAIARLLVTMPQLLLLDEPFSNLDMIHKTLLKVVIQDIGNKLGISCILVSHDPLDTLSWADEIIVLRRGQIAQKGTPLEIYHRPVNEYVAALFGNYNLINPMLFRHVNGVALTDKKKIFARPEALKVVKGGNDGLEAVVHDVYFLGSVYEAEVVIGWENFFIRTGQALKKGDTVFVSLSPVNWYL